MLCCAATPRHVFRAFSSRYETVHGQKSAKGKIEATKALHDCDG